jgi:hypothetical protein
MQLELQCCRCAYHSTVYQHPRTSQIWNQLTEEGPWFALGDGQTFEDRISATLIADDETRCPECGGRLAVSEESLAEASRELLTQW